MDQPKYTVRCPACRTEHQGWDDETIYYGCGYCQAQLRWHVDEFVKHTTLDQPTQSSTFTLGATGILNGRTWRIISFAQRIETGTLDGIWQEYLLYDEIEYKYAWLSEFEGHWLFVESIPETDIDTTVKADIDAKRSTLFMDMDFEPYHKYKAKYRYFSGEAPYRLLPADCIEYICPPYVLTKEKTEDGTDYSLATYIGPRTVRKAFAPVDGMPRRIGVGSAQPFFKWFEARAMMITTFVFCLLIWGMQTYLNDTARRQEVFSQYVSIDEKTEGKQITTSSFEITGDPAVLEIKSRGSVDNSWVEASIDLVNENTGEEKSFALGVEYYHGVDGGESWSEGSTGSTERLCAIGPGRYHLVITPYKDTKTVADWIEIYGYHDPKSWWNALFAMFVMAGIAIGLIYWESRFERKRWYGAKFTPYHEDEEE